MIFTWRAAESRDDNLVLQTQKLPENAALILQASLEELEDYRNDPLMDYMVFETSESKDIVAFCLLKHCGEEQIELRRLLVFEKGKSYGTKSLGRIIEYTFDELHKHVIFLDVFRHNKIAIRLYEKAGFVKKEGANFFIKHRGNMEELIVMKMNRF